MERQEQYRDPVPLELIELEEHAKEHKTEAPHAKKYAFRVDKERVVGSPWSCNRVVLFEFPLTFHNRRSNP